MSVMTDAPGARDVVVTGMGFCLPGIGQPVRTTDDLWSIASAGRTSLTADEIYHASVGITEEQFNAYVPGIPETFAKHFTKAHQFGLVSFVQAAADAGLDILAGDLTEAVSTPTSRATCGPFRPTRKRSAPSTRSTCTSAPSRPPPRRTWLWSSRRWPARPGPASPPARAAPRRRPRSATRS